MLCEAAGFKNNHTGSLLKSNLVPTGSQAGCGVREFCASAQELRSRVQQRCGPKRYASTKIKLQSSPLRHALSKTFPRKVRGTADPSASLGMTKGRGNGFINRGCCTEALGRRPMIPPVEITTLLNHSWSIVHWVLTAFSDNKFVISTGAVMGLRPSQGDEKRLGAATTVYETIALSFCHPERSRGICSSADHSWKCFRQGMALPVCLSGNHHFPMQKVEKIKLRISSVVVSPVSESR
jgi:hypothetical protein